MIPLSTMTAAWTVLVPLAEQAPDPSKVRPGWLGLITFILLVVAVVLLVLSFRKQLRKVNFENRGNGSAGEGDAPGDKGGSRNGAAPDRERPGTS